MSKNYVNNKVLFDEIVKYKETGKMSEELGSMVKEIAENYITKGSFSGYTWKDDMIGEALLTCVKYLKTFNPEKTTNAFAYVTTMCKNSFIMYLNTQNKHSNIKNTLHNSLAEKKIDGSLQFFDYTELV